MITLVSSPKQRLPKDMQHSLDDFGLVKILSLDCFPAILDKIWGYLRMSLRLRHIFRKPKIEIIWTLLNVIHLLQRKRKIVNLWHKKWTPKIWFLWFLEVCTKTQEQQCLARLFFGQTSTFCSAPWRSISLGILRFLAQFSYNFSLFLFLNHN